MFPLSDAPNPPRTPIVTYALILVNVLVFLAFTLPMSGQQPSPGDPRVAAYVEALRESLPANVPIQDAVASLSVYDLFIFEHGFKPGAAQVSNLLTAMFLHAGFMHLFGNMLFLWIYGDNVEYRLGRLPYLFWYLVTGVAATLAFSLLAPGSLIPMVGASGAISGVLGFYFIWFPQQRRAGAVALLPVPRSGRGDSRADCARPLPLHGQRPADAGGRRRRRRRRRARCSHRRLRGGCRRGVGALAPRGAGDTAGIPGRSPGHVCAGPARRSGRARRRHGDGSTCLFRAASATGAAGARPGAIARARALAGRERPRAGGRDGVPAVSAGTSHRSGGRRSARRRRHDAPEATGPASRRLPAPPGGPAAVSRTRRGGRGSRRPGRDRGQPEIASATIFGLGIASERRPYPRKRTRPEARS